MFRKFNSAIFVLLVLTAGCATKVDVESSRTALRTADAEWSNAANNVDSFMTFVAADGTMMPPNEPAVSGSDNVRAWVTKMMGMPGFSVSWQPASADVAASGELGYTSGTYELRMQGPNGEAINDHGKYLAIWKREADGWKVAYDIFNSDVAPPSNVVPTDTTATP